MGKFPGADVTEICCAWAPPRTVRDPRRPSPAWSSSAPPRPRATSTRRTTSSLTTSKRSTRRTFRWPRVRLAAACRSSRRGPFWAGRRELLCFPGPSGSAGRRGKPRGDHAQKGHQAVTATLSVRRGERAPLSPWPRRGVPAGIRMIRRGGRSHRLGSPVRPPVSAPGRATSAHVSARERTRVNACERA